MRQLVYIVINCMPNAFFSEPVNNSVVYVPVSSCVVMSITKLCNKIYRYIFLIVKLTAVF